MVLFCTAWCNRRASGEHAGRCETWCRSPVGPYAGCVSMKVVRAAVASELCSQLCQHSMPLPNFQEDLRNCVGVQG
eukprot:1137703-Pelagomonas_calceolata.AAC.4